MPTLAIVPMKSFDGAKQPLQDDYTPGQRRALTEAMFSDVLIARRRTASLDETLVVSVDRGARPIAAGYGALVRPDDDRGHDRAAIAGIGEALKRGADRALLVPGDCPMLDHAQLDQLLARPAPVGSVLIVPDRHGTGTNALLLTPPDALEPSFGPAELSASRGARRVIRSRPRGDRGTVAGS